MKIYYSPETDSLNIKLREGKEEVEGHIAGRLYEIEVLWGEQGGGPGPPGGRGLPVSMTQTGFGQHESKVS